MNTKIIRRVSTTAFISFLAAFLSYVSNSDYIFSLLINNNILNATVDVNAIQDVCLWVGIAISAIGLSRRLIIAETKHEQVLEERNQLIQMNKDLLSGALTNICTANVMDFDIRIFLPKYPRWYKFCRKFSLWNCKEKFVIKNVDVIAEARTTSKLEFEVFPNAQGLVGTCYKEAALVYDDNLEVTNSTNYNLTRYQITRTSDLKWCICCPIFDSNDAVVAILALDGRTLIRIDAQNKDVLVNQILTFSNMLYASVPQLFRR